MCVAEPITDHEVVVVWDGETIDGREYPEQRYSPPPVGLDPHPFDIAEFEAIPVEKLELWDGVLYGPTFQQEAMLVALLSNVGLRRALQLVPRERWLKALDESR